MSANVLDEVLSLRPAPILLEQLADLINVKPHSFYPYLSHRELAYSQLRTFIRRSGCVELQREFFNDLFGGTGWTATYTPASLDVTGDGEIDTRDALKKGAKAAKKLAVLLERLADHDDRSIDEAVSTELNREGAEAVECTSIALQVVAYIAAHNGKRHRLSNGCTAGLGVRRV